MILFWADFHRSPSEWGVEEMIIWRTFPGHPLKTCTITFVEYAPIPSEDLFDGDAGPV